MDCSTYVAKLHEGAEVSVEDVEPFDMDDVINVVG